LPSCNIIEGQGYAKLLDYARRAGLVYIICKKILFNTLNKKLNR